MTFAHIVELAAEGATRQRDEFDGEMPDQSDRLLVARVADLADTIRDIEHRRASESYDEDEETIATLIESAAVDIILATGTLETEYDIDLVEAVEERVEFIEEYHEVRDMLEGAETDAERREILSEELDLLAPEDLTGQDVTEDEYDGEPRGFQ